MLHRRCCPRMRNTRRLDTSNPSRTWPMHRRRRAGLGSFPASPPAESACPMSGPRSRGTAGGSPPPDPLSANLTQLADDLLKLVLLGRHSSSLPRSRPS
ncbi:hypothetical protein GGR49_002604 [Sphingomonas carotinifaciens]|nr:hypothetical protein [Sphingomonas carotinifaciens]